MAISGSVILDSPSGGARGRPIEGPGNKRRMAQPYFMVIAILFSSYCCMAAHDQHWEVDAIPQQWHDALKAKVAALANLKSMSDRVAGYTAFFKQAVMQDGLAEPEHVALARQVRAVIVKQLDTEMAALTTSVSIARTMGEKEHQTARMHLSAVMQLRAALADLPLTEENNLRTAVDRLDGVMSNLPSLLQLCGPVAMSTQQVASQSGSTIKKVTRHKKSGNVVTACMVGGILVTGLAVGLVFALRRERRVLSADSAVVVKEVVKSDKATVDMSTQVGDGLTKNEVTTLFEQESGVIYLKIFKYGCIDLIEGLIWIPEGLANESKQELRAAEIEIGQVRRSDGMVSLHNVPNSVYKAIAVTA